MQETFLKPETVQELQETFKEVTAGPDEAYILINERGSKIFLNIIVEILRNNNEPGPLRLHESAAKTFNCLYGIYIFKEY